MTRTKVLVTGSTGKTGFPTVAELCRLGHEVRAVVHREDDRSAALRQLGAEIVVADLYDSKQMASAMAGISAASFCPPIQPYMIEAANVFAVAAHYAGVQHIVQVSQWLAHPHHPSIHTRQLRLVEEILRMLPSSTYTLINPGVFADPILQLLPAAIHFGMMPNIFVGLINPPASNEDMGRVSHMRWQNPSYTLAGVIVRRVRICSLCKKSLTRSVASWAAPSSFVTCQLKHS